MKNDDCATVFSAGERALSLPKRELLWKILAQRKRKLPFWMRSAPWTEPLKRVSFIKITPLAARAA